LRQLLETRTRLRRPDHSDVLGPRMNLALAVGELGRVAAGLAAARGPSTATRSRPVSRRSGPASAEPRAGDRKRAGPRDKGAVGNRRPQAPGHAQRPGVASRAPA
jgi:hypothetical protein